MCFASIQCSKMRLRPGRGLAPDHSGSLQRSPDPVAERLRPEFEVDGVLGPSAEKFFLLSPKL